jgi:hypothetical protein
MFPSPHSLDGSSRRTSTKTRIARRKRWHRIASRIVKEHRAAQSLAVSTPSWSAEAFSPLAPPMGGFPNQQFDDVSK